MRKAIVVVLVVATASVLAAFGGFSMNSSKTK